MCLGIPGKIIKINEFDVADVEMGENTGNIKQAGLHLVPNAKIGDYVLIHAGFAIQLVDEEEALETLELFRQMSESDEAS